ncbi:hypothetical protein FGE12_23625 [Aggregicoccus sp. 17bor-14]|uniref:hypothetical protein n=1 Tax=Myxococcaceae TaxID=31 RepID=UPI00129C1106|nr:MULTISPECIES: hypothetical protein [Myxococcaceae]MBF5045416.1 hypothetical protein [Simulacricoccus sp. 17bor-14]MRI91157.1 hypothetical protein [Aggregicoccus sp. 17bor-14]
MQDVEARSAREARWGWRLLGLFTLALLVTLVAVFFWNLRPVRRHDGQWTWVRVLRIRWPTSGLRTREYEDFEDTLLRREWDLDGDGRYECREEPCPERSAQPEARCVSRLQEGRWVEAPELASCTELTRPRE